MSTVTMVQIESVHALEKLTFEDKQDSSKQLGDTLRPLISKFLSGLGYTPFKASNPAVLAAMIKEADRIGLKYPEGSSARRCFMMGALFAELCFPNHPLEVQVYVGFYTCYGFLIDDETSRSQEDSESFVERFCKGQPQPTPALQGWANVIRDAYVHFDPAVANFIVAASLDYLTINVMESRADFSRIQSTPGGASFPYYVRGKDGLAEAYAYFAFPKALCPDLSKFVEAIPDMMKFINLGNDILSFYKEELKAEEVNYIHSRGYYEKKDSISVFKDIIDEALGCYNRMAIVFKGRGEYERTWHEYVMGYVAFHKLNARYRLSELGFGEAKNVC